MAQNQSSIASVSFVYEGNCVNYHLESIIIGNSTYYRVSSYKYTHQSVQIREMLVINRDEIQIIGLSIIISAIITICLEIQSTFGLLTALCIACGVIKYIIIPHYTVSRVRNQYLDLIRIRDQSIEVQEYGVTSFYLLNYTLLEVGPSVNWLGLNTKLVHNIVDVGVRDFLVVKDTLHIYSLSGRFKVMPIKSKFHSLDSDSIQSTRLINCGLTSLRW